MAVDGIAANGVTEILKNLNFVVANEITLVWDFNDELKNLQSTLNMILAVMEDAENKQVSSKSVRLWMEELKSIAFDAEDILDDYSYKLLIGKRTQTGKVRKPSLFFRWRMAHKIKKINENFNKIAKRKNDLGLQTIDGAGSSSSSSHTMMMMENRETYSLVAADWKIVGRENDKSKIINTLLDKDSCLVLSIVGLGGLGKTTMAQQVYNDEAIEKHFQLKIWICVSDPFVVKKLLKNIVNSSGADGKYDDGATMDDIVHGLQNALREKKFLLVLDDVWNKNSDDWYKLKTPLMVGAEGSKILVTTRSVEVASIMVDKFPPYPLGILNDNDSWSLFKEIAFGSAVGAVETPELMKIGKEMVERCGGLPLAVIFLGSLMRSKKKEEEWKNIRDTKIWHESKEGGKSERVILPSLRLSYVHLPSYLKQCFSYCCLFPKDFIIEKETLIRFWMAEGFLIESPGDNAMSMEEIGSEYFHILLSNFFFQDVKRNEDGDIVTCKMHDLVHDLARSVVGKNECLIVENANDIDCISEATIRLNLVNVDEGMLPKVLEALKNAKKLRTVCVGVFVDFKEVTNQERAWFDIEKALIKNLRLRVLDLHRFNYIQGSTSLIGELKHLRYLHLPGTFTIPKGIGRLKFLQTLNEFNLGYTIPKSPGRLGCSYFGKKNAGVVVGSGIEELEGSSHLTGDLRISHLERVTSETAICRANLKEKSTIPKSPGRLGCYYFGKKNAGVVVGSGIEELEGLSHLTGDLRISHLERVTSGTAICRANLKEKKRLLGLNLYWEGDDDDAIITHEVVLEGLRPPPNLRTLVIRGFVGSKLPRWIEDSSCLPNLVRLKFICCSNERLAGFGVLPSLRSLTLDVVEELECIGNELYYSAAAAAAGTTTTTIAFPSLKTLTLQSMSSLREWVVPAVPPPQASTTTTGATTNCFPLLEKITINNCYHFTTITPTTTIFPSLKVLELLVVDGRVAKTLVTNHLNYSLTSLTLEEIYDLVSLPHQGLMENNDTLLYLSIRSCPQFKGFLPLNMDDDDDDDDQGGGGQQLQEVVTSSSSSSSSLRSLTLYDCPAMRFYPNIRSLTSLRELEIQECKVSRSLQDELTCLSSSSSLEHGHLEHVQILKDNTAGEVVVFEWRKQSLKD